jgi:predicted lipid-binding transport protein (Tim44 family)
LGAEEARTRQGEGEPAEQRPSPRAEQIVDDQHRGSSRESQSLPASEPQTGSSADSVHRGGTEVAEAETSLIEAQEANEYRSRWNDIQGGFVDEPRETLAKADQLVAEVIQQLTRTFADERSRFEEQWTRGADVSTEDLRLAFRRYRSFFNGLLP